MTEAIAEVTRDNGPVTGEGPKALGLRPPRHRRAQSRRRGGAQASVALGETVLRQAWRYGRGKAVPFLFRPKHA
ncbi:hypothetical protein U716_07065 [Rhodobacter capsulatus B6]|nr:hypothetical protein U716_07065 [Rhodobacter capsulatus B6]